MPRRAPGPRTRAAGGYFPEPDLLELEATEPVPAAPELPDPEDEPPEPDPAPPVAPPPEEVSELVPVDALLLSEPEADPAPEPEGDSERESVR